MTKVLYIAGEMSRQNATAAQVRIRAVLPRLARNIDLRVLGFSPTAEPVTAADLGLDVPFEVIAHKRTSMTDKITATLRRRPRSFRRFESAAAHLALQTALREHRPDVVHMDGFATLGLMPVIRQEAPNARIIAHIHDAQSVFQSRFTQGQATSFAFRVQNRIEQRKLRRFESTELGKAHLTLVDSSEDRDYLRGIVRPGRVDMLPLGFEPAAFSPTGPIVPLDQPALVFSGSMKASQSIDGAIFLAREVMPLVWRKHPGAHLYVVGGNPTAEVQALAGPKIHVTGFVEDLASYLRASRVYTCALRRGSGMRTRVVEALACGTTMVANELAVRGLATPEPVAPWTLAASAEDFAQAIDTVLSGERPSTGEAAARYALSSYSWDSVVQKLLSYYSATSDTSRIQHQSPGIVYNPLKARILNLIMPGFLIEALARLCGALAEVFLPDHMIVVEDRVRARLQNLKYGYRCSAIGRNVVISKPRRVSLGRNTSLHSNCVVNVGAKGHFSLGDGSHISHGTVISASAGLSIGKNCSISSGVALYTATNQREDGKPVSQSPILLAPIAIGDDVLIGANVTILPGVRVGNGAVLGAGSVVTRDVEDDTVVTGIPAKSAKQFRMEPMQ